MSAPLLKEQAVRYLVVHCSATSPKVRVDKAVIDRWHREKGWFGCGYHFVIKRDGVVETARRDADGNMIVGAHVEGHNHEAIGICLAGGVDANNKPEDNFTDAQYVALAAVLTDLLKSHTRAAIVGHRDLNPHKACPSFDVGKWWHETVAAPEVDA